MGLLNPGGPIAQFKRNRCSISPVEVILLSGVRMKDAETRHFIAHAFRDGVIKTTGTDIDNLMPPISRFGGGNRAAKKQTIIEKLKVFFDRFFGI